MSYLIAIMSAQEVMSLISKSYRRGKTLCVLKCKLMSKNNMSLCFQKVIHGVIRFMEKIYSKLLFLFSTERQEGKEIMTDICGCTIVRC